MTMSSTMKSQIMRLSSAGRRPMSSFSEDMIGLATTAYVNVKTCTPQSFSCCDVLDLEGMLCCRDGLIGK